MAGYYYVGDFTDAETSLNRVYPGANIALQFDGKASVQFQLNVGFGQIMEQYDYNPPTPVAGVRNNDFIETTFFYMDARLRYRFLKRYKVQPYVGTGAGILIFSPKDQKGKLLGDALITRPQGETYNTAVPVIPGVVGVMGRLNPVLALGMEYVYRFTPTDYLDNTGELGRKEGNDQLHALQVSMYITIKPRSADRPTVRPVEPEDSLFVVKEDSATTASIPEEVASNANDNEDKNNDKNEDKPNEEVAEGKPEVIEPVAPPLELTEIDFALITPPTKEEDAFPVEREVVTPPSVANNQDTARVWPDFVEIPRLTSLMPIVEVDAYQFYMPEPVGEVDTVDWVKKEEEAMYLGKYIYYRVRSTDNLRSISIRFKTRISTIRRLNFMDDERIYEGTYLRLPNLGIPPNNDEEE